MSTIQAELAPRKTDGQFNVYDPANRQTLGTLHSFTSEEIAAVGAKARAAQPRWAATPPAARWRVIRRFPQPVCEQKDAVPALVNPEARRPPAEPIPHEIL